jgi:3-deoxy-manno-octulosonate cytidylyltransferase (CMP-KDO synthetase)
MIQWVYEGAIQCKSFSKVIVATDSEDIASVIRNIGGHVEMTPPELPTGTDRVAYVSKKYPEFNVVVNCQGDQPFIKAHMLEKLVSPYFTQNTIPAMATLACPIHLETEYADPNTVKVILNKFSNAIYFSRSPIPFYRVQTEKNVPIYMHLGLYAFEKEFLHKFTNLEQTPLEKTELLEQLRALENGIPIYVSLTHEKIIEINYPEDLVAAEAHLKELM